MELHKDSYMDIVPLKIGIASMASKCLMPYFYLIL